MKKTLPILAVIALSLSACSGPNPDDLRQSDPDGHTACMHYGGSLTAPADMGATNKKKAAEHGSTASTAAIRDAVSTNAEGQPEITDAEAFTKACEAQGFDFDK